MEPWGGTFQGKHKCPNLEGEINLSVKEDGEGRCGWRGATEGRVREMNGSREVDRDQIM